MRNKSSCLFRAVIHVKSQLCGSSPVEHLSEPRSSYGEALQDIVETVQSRSEPLYSAKIQVNRGSGWYVYCFAPLSMLEKTLKEKSRLGDLTFQQLSHTVQSERR